MTGLRFRETMTGRVAMRTSDPVAGFASAGAVAATMHAEVRIADVDVFVSDDRQKARLRVQLVIPVLGIDALSEDGTFELFTPGFDADRRPVRQMVYTARLDTGQRVYQMSAHKILQPSRHPWSDTTTAHVVLVELTEDRRPVRAAGFVKISPWRFLVELTTMRGFGQESSSEERRRAVLTYVRHFVRGLVMTYLRRAWW